MRGLSGFLFQLVRLVGAIYISTEAYMKVNQFTGDCILSAFTAIVLAITGVALVVDSDLPTKRKTWGVRVFFCAQVMIFFCVHALIALFLSGQVQKALMESLGGYPVTRSEAFALILASMLLMEVFLMVLPSSEYPRESGDEQQNLPRTTAIRNKGRIGINVKAGVGTA